ncbi:MAG: MBL fold metallo-hydrolase [Anaerolineaceae bacterium]|nr:MBL fold metallo-hydrolase [Anaerolineaceae bacterium]
MEITWYGHSCFRISERSMASVVTDPFDSEVVGLAPLKLKAEIVTVSCNMPGHNYLKAVKGDVRTIMGPGEYEIGGVFITGMQTNGHKKNEEEKHNTLYMIDYGSFTIAHLGEMTRVPSQADIETLGTVNIALVPVGDLTSLNAAKAAEVISLLEPNIVIPMHYDTPGSKMNLDPLGKFLKEMGLNQLETMESFKITSSTSLPEETKVIVLDRRS